MGEKTPPLNHYNIVIGWAYIYSHSLRFQRSQIKYYDQNTYFIENCCNIYNRFNI